MSKERYVNTCYGCRYFYADIQNGYSICHCEKEIYENCVHTVPRQYFNGIKQLKAGGENDNLRK